MKKLKNNGFTLNELIVSMAVFSLIAGIVISFIVYLNSFINNAKNQQEISRNQLLLQNYTSLWFSYYDNNNFNFLVYNEEDLVACAQDAYTQNCYYIKAQAINNNLQITFEFPTNSNYETIILNCNGANKFLIEKYSQSENADKNNSFIFTVLLHVKSEFFSCNLIYTEV
ncbi:MAG: type II secretion system protein [Clostridiales bacterium]|nr:type II secretion system protein [Clostridiales bacterium]